MTRFIPTHYRGYADFLERNFTCKVQKVPVDAGFTCPNRDGKLRRGGCIYCNNSSFTPAYCDPTLPVDEQIEAGKRFLSHKYPHMHYLAYFQAYTGTYAPVERLRELYTQALAVPDVVGLLVATRPDCLSIETIALLKELRRRTFVMVELGVETFNNATLSLVGRGCVASCAVATLLRLGAAGIPVCAHLILGLPGEEVSDIEHSVEVLSDLPVDVVKFHQLQVLRGTSLARNLDRYRHMMHFTLPQYVELCAHLLTRLNPAIAVERFVSEAPQNMVVTPRWGVRPQQVMLAVEDYMTKKKLHQGQNFLPK